MMQIGHFTKGRADQAGNYNLRFLVLMSMSENYMHCGFCILVLNRTRVMILIHVSTAMGRKMET